MKKRKLLINAVVLLLVLLAGNAVASEYVTPPGVLSPAQVDFGGKTVTIIRGKLPNDSERVAQAEELFNVKLATLRIDNPDQFIARVMSGDSTYDIIRHQHREGYYALVSQGLALPVEDYLPDEFFESLPNVDRYTIEKLKFRGNRYGIGITSGIVNDSMMIMTYNKDILEAYDQPDPYELYLNGEWTYDAFEQIAIAITDDTDGDGIIDQFGVNRVASYGAFIRFAVSNGAEIAVQEDGKWVFGYDKENAINALNAIVRWNDLGIMGGEFGNYDAGEVGFKIYTHLGGNRNAQANGIRTGMVPMPMGPDVDRYHYPAFDFFITYLPVNVEYPEGLIALTNFLYREEDSHDKLEQMINDWMTEKEHLDMYNVAVENWLGEGDVFQAGGLWEMMKEPIESVIHGLKGAGAAMDEVAPRAQAFLDDLFDQ